jgi:hypothetical protein
LEIIRQARTSLGNQRNHSATKEITRQAGKITRQAMKSFGKQRNHSAGKEITRQARPYCGNGSAGAEIQLIFLSLPLYSVITCLFYSDSGDSRGRQAP